jgi:soluble cytochrome b562
VQTDKKTSQKKAYLCRIKTSINHIIMKTKREEKLEKQLEMVEQALSASRKALHRERQKNRDMSQSRDKYKIKNKILMDKIKESEALKKNGKLDLHRNSLSTGINTVILSYH